MHMFTGRYEFYATKHTAFRGQTQSQSSGVVLVQNNHLHFVETRMRMKSGNKTYGS